MKTKSFVMMLLTVLWLSAQTLPHLIQGEYFIDSDPGIGSGIPLQTDDANWDEIFETIISEQTSALTEGPHFIGIRLYSGGQWSTTYKVPFFNNAGMEKIPHLISGEYFIDTDPGTGNGIPLIASDNNWDQVFERIVNESLVDLSDGAHRVGVRIYAGAQWSQTFFIPFINNSGAAFLSHIIRGEYFINTDPGEGAGYPFIATDGAFDQLFESFTADHPLSQLETKSYTLYARLFVNNQWTGSFGMVFSIPDTTPPAPPQEFTVTGRNNRIELSWRKNPESDLKGYVIYKDADSANVITISDSLIELTKEDTTYIDSTVANGTTMYYAIVAVDTNGNRSTPRVVAGATAGNSAPYFTAPFADVMLEEDAQSLKIGVLSQLVLDVDGDNLNFSVFNPDSAWLHVFIEHDSLIILPEPDSSGSTQIIFTASDAELSASDTFMVTVTPVNDLPVITELPDTLQLNIGEIQQLYLPAYVSDVEDSFDSLAIELDFDSGKIIASFDRVSDTLEISVVNQIYESTWLKIRVSDGDQGVTTDSIYCILNSILSVDDDQNRIPKTVELMQNYPNPFNPTTTIRFGLPHADQVTLELYNLLGQRVAVLLNEQRKAGYHSITVDFSQLPTGLYFYSLRTTDRIVVRKMVFMK